jgi:PIN domain nuclease of toxin-antitoxin system
VSKKLVLDTHVLLNAARGKQVSKATMKLIDRVGAAGNLFVSAITPWEIALLSRHGQKLRLNGDGREWTQTALERMQVNLVPLSPAIAFDAVNLVWDHDDPADRIIVAAAREIDATLVTADTEILEYAEATGAVKTMEPNRPIR